VGGDESNEKKFRRLFRAALDTEVEPGLSALGFKIEGTGGYSLPWSSALDFATNIREGKWNKFGVKKFDVDVLFSLDDRDGESQGAMDLEAKTRIRWWLGVRVA
jgi:hypothetical protein